MHLVVSGAGVFVQQVIYSLSFSGMAEDQVNAAIQIQSLNEVLKREVKPGDEMLPYESRINFYHLSQFPLVMRQTEWLLGWNIMDGLYQFVSRLPAYLIDNDVFAQWLQDVELPTENSQAFMGMDTDHIVSGGQALLLSLALLFLMPAPEGRCQEEGYSPSLFVYSVVTVFVHPDQELAMIGDAVEVLLSTRQSIIVGTGPNGQGRGMGCSVLCELPQYSYGHYFPCLKNEAYLVIPVGCDDGKYTLLLDQPVIWMHMLQAWRLHTMAHHTIDSEYPVMHAVLPLMFGEDPTTPSEKRILYVPHLWKNAMFSIFGGEESDICPVTVVF